MLGAVREEATAARLPTLHLLGMVQSSLCQEKGTLFHRAAQPGLDSC